MVGRLHAKVVIVTGGATGIGRAVAGRIVAEGGAVVIAGRREDAGEQAAAELRKGGGQALFAATDVTVEREAERLVQVAVAEFGQLDGAVNNAGGVNAMGPVPAVDSVAWHAELEHNLTSVFYCLKFQIPAMTGGGSIINNASIGGVRGIPGLGAYVAAKHGVVGLTRSAALEGAARSVRVNALVAGCHVGVVLPQAHGAVDQLPDDIGMPGVPVGFGDHVHQDPAQRHISPALRPPRHVAGRV
jgi:NAD(P)-dependent dehydrogenase (short-subunit alcohol dehydrogenase family)